MHLVREMKKYGEINVANAIGSATGWYWPNPKNRPKNIEKMVESLPKCDLERVLNELHRVWGVK